MQLVTADDFSRRDFQMHFVGALKVNTFIFFEKRYIHVVHKL